MGGGAGKGLEAKGSRPWLEATPSGQQQRALITHKQRSLNMEQHQPIEYSATVGSETEGWSWSLG